MNNVYFPQKFGYVLENEDQAGLHAMFSLLQLAGEYTPELASLVVNTSCYLKYDLLRQQTELVQVDSYPLLSYAMGLYYEQFSFCHVDNFLHYLLRNMKMRVSVPLVRIPAASLGLESSFRKEMYVLAAGFDPASDELIIVHPRTNAYERIGIRKHFMEEYEFILLNFPDMIKPKVIRTYRNRMHSCYNLMLSRKIKDSRWLFGHEAIQYMQERGLKNSDLEAQLNMLNHLMTEVG